ncbi:SSU ribosomal protein S21P [Geoalkalibacter ferrihydriticus]|uniref:Small ribosomal subunit protein bS21 n=2 Tax=Geoalkalibacter ferrihydriticus TaxID=392333 RepID=A0A0C2HLV7_9BACT|nr:30S ribosomal protein S21 [Geoalkalibacter ferrihydriticus]KIH75970.1 30S ribosomal protein S21 [Geoalkalibacter ferrihydriticus DSM 17813]SDM57692.1 SSU ribosomal protein S21P [Geoalkalibacter ferrihydriticus]
MEIKVHNDDLTKAMKVMKRKLQQDGFFRDLKKRRFYEKPSERRKRKETEAARRLRKKARKMARSSH